MINKNIVYAINGAITLLQAEKRPLQPGVNERAFAHRLAVHMEGSFPGWDVDCEYNKHGMNIKALEGIQACDEQKKTDRIYPDIIVHKRTNDSPIEENLLVIEMKRNDACDPCDERKLQLLTDFGREYRYQLGLYINIQDNQFINTWYSNGVVIEEVLLNM
jgi:hypothetical protein